MLKAEIDLADLSEEPEWKGDVIAFGDSRIRPYMHTALETLLVRTQRQWFVVVRECQAGREAGGKKTHVVDDGRFAEMYRENLMWPLDYLLVEGAQQGRRIRMRAGAFGSAPVYFRTTAERLTVSWDLDDFMAEPLVIDPQAVSQHLALSKIYSAQHVCAGLSMLTERASLHVAPGRVHYQYPAAAEPVSQPSLSDDENVPEAFEKRLLHSVSMRPMQGRQIVVELSGGMDSATVAGALTTSYGPVASAGILLTGESRHPQIARRSEIVRRLDLNDGTVDIEAFPPSLDLQPRGRREYPFPELYLEAFEQMWGHAREQGCEFLFTGLGGDELFGSYVASSGAATDCKDPLVSESRLKAASLLTPRAQSAARATRAFDAPGSVVSESVLLASSCQAPYLLQMGLWPVNPLSDPRLAAFCQRLPAAWREQREIMRHYLNARLGDDVFPRGYVKETFANVLPSLISQHASSIASQLQECALADLGIVDHGAALSLLDEVATTRADAAMAPLASFLWLERFVRRVA